MRNIILSGILLLSILSGCNSESTTTNPNELSAYGVMQVAFEGYPDSSEFAPMLDDLILRHFQEEGDRELKLGLGNRLVELRKASLVGVTETEIIKHSYQNWDGKRMLKYQFYLSAQALEKTK